MEMLSTQTAESALHSAVEVEIRSHVDPDYWNDIVRTYSHGGFLDTSNRFDEFIKCHPDTKMYYLIGHKNAREVGWMAFCETYHGHDIVTLKSHLRPLKPICERTMRTFDCFTVPMVADDVEEGEIVTALIDAAENLARERGVFQMVHLRYPAPGRKPAPGLSSADFGSRSYKSLRHGTFLIDLSVGEEVLWKRLKREARTGVRKAAKQGLSVRLGQGEKDIRLFYEIFIENRVRDSQKGMPRPLYSYKIMHDHIQDLSRLGLLSLFFAEKDGEVGSCTIVKNFNGRAMFNNHARSNKWYEGKYHDGDLLCWEMIKGSKQQGYSRFDMTGFDADPANDRQLGIKRFKSKWGGECVYYNIYSKVFGEKRNALLGLARRVLR